MKRYAVLTNNMQIATANKHEARRLSVDKFLPSLVTFLNNIRSAGIPVIHLQLAYKYGDNKASEPFGSFPPLLSGTDGVKILPEILHITDIVIEKSRDSGFFQSDLDNVLKKLQITTVIITGMQAYSCVQFTTADAYLRGYETIVNSDAVGSTRDEDTERALKCMQKYCAKVFSSKEIYEILKI